MRWGDRGGVAVLIAVLAVVIWGMFGVMNWLRLG